MYMYMTHISITMEESESAEAKDPEPFRLLTDDLQRQIASYLSPKDLLSFCGLSSEFSALDVDALWREQCIRRWSTWPRYSINDDNRRQEFEKRHPNTLWKDRYRIVYQEATSTNVTTEDLVNLKWYLSFVLSGVRGETRSDFVQVRFTPMGTLLVPGYPPLPYHIENGHPPSSSNQIPLNLRGDQPFSTQQWLRVSDFPPHFVTRKLSNAEWLIVNENVMFVSCKQD